MNIERDKFLTKAMGECWHEFTTYPRHCDKCGDFINSQSLPPLNNNFSTWQGFGELWEWAQQQEWWTQFFADRVAKSYATELAELENLVHPDRFANAVYKFLY